MGAAPTLSNHESDLQVRVINGLKGNDEEVDRLLDDVGLHHCLRSRMPFQRFRTIPAR